jgi:hypothetical protein
MSSNHCRAPSDSTCRAIRDIHLEPNGKLSIVKPEPPKDE